MRRHRWTIMTADELPGWEAQKQQMIRLPAAALR
jgi:hypothetical protein